MLIADFKKSPKFAKLKPFIKEHVIFNHISKIEKPFPLIGLKNSLEPFNEEFSDKIPGKQYYIGFSSSGINGTWDIATMSMRGVCSCMHWDNVHSKHIVGSMIDPFLGILYITDKKMTPYGVSFKFRSLVRIVHCYKNRGSCLFLERVYRDSGNTDPEIYNNRISTKSNIKKHFDAFLKEKSTLPIITGYANSFARYPFSGQKNLDYAYLSMSDAQLPISLNSSTLHFDNPKLEALIKKSQVQT